MNTSSTHPPPEAPLVSDSPPEPSNNHTAEAVLSVIAQPALPSDSSTVASTAEVSPTPNSSRSVVEPHDVVDLTVSDTVSNGDTRQEDRMEKASQSRRKQTPTRHKKSASKARAGGHAKNGASKRTNGSNSNGEHAGKNERTIAVRVSIELDEFLKSLAEERGISKSVVVRDACPSPPHPSMAGFVTEVSLKGGFIVRPGRNGKWAVLRRNGETICGDLTFDDAWKSAHLAAMTSAA